MKQASNGNASNESGVNTPHKHSNNTSWNKQTRRSSTATTHNETSKQWRHNTWEWSKQDAHSNNTQCNKQIMSMMSMMSMMSDEYDVYDEYDEYDEYYEYGE